MKRSVLQLISVFGVGHPPLTAQFAGAMVAAASNVDRMNQSQGVIDAQKGALKSASSKEEQNAPRVTTLPNGVRLITQQHTSFPSNPNTSIGVYVRAGPKFDPLHLPGLSHVCRLALTTSNMNKSLFQLDRGLRSVGASLDHFEIRKTFLGLRLDVRSDLCKDVCTDLFTCISAPRFHEADIERFRDTFDNQYEELRWQQPREYAIQHVESLSFFKEPLGSPRMVPPTSNGAITTRALVDSWSSYCTPDRVVVAGVNISHQELLSLYENSPFPHSSLAPHHARGRLSVAHAASAHEEVATKSAYPSPTSKQTPAPASPILPASQLNEQLQYTAGTELCEEEDRPGAMGTKPDMNQDSIAAISYLTFGRDGSLADYAATLVFKQLLRMVTGEPLAARKQDGTTRGSQVFFSPFSTAGLLGFSIQTDPEQMTSELVRLLKLIPSLKFSANSELSLLLEGAKRGAAIDFILQSEENVREFCDFLGTSFVRSTGADASHASGMPSMADIKEKERVVTIDDILKRIQAVKLEDVARVQQLALAQKPCLFLTGATNAVPSLMNLLKSAGV